MADQEKRDQKYSTKRPAVKEHNNNDNKINNKINVEKKFKGEKDPCNRLHIHTLRGALRYN